MAKSPVVLICIGLLPTVLYPVTSARVRGRRSDDIPPLEVVVNALTQRVDQLTAQLQAQDAKNLAQDTQMADLRTKLEADEQTVAFTARFSTGDIHGMGIGQTLKFDSVLYNAGSGYDPVSGIFTAPSSGTYFFVVTVMKHSDEPTASEIGIYKGSTLIAAAYGCCTKWDTSSGHVTVHMNKGDSVHVQMVHGSSLYGGRYTSFSGIKISPN